MATRLVPRTSLRLCDSLRISTAQLRFYSTQPTDHVASKHIATSDGASRDKDDRERRDAYRRQYMARRRADPEFRAQEKQYHKDHYARNPAKKMQKHKEWLAHKLATDPEWTLAYRQKCMSSYFNPETHEASKDIKRQYKRTRRAEDPTCKLNDYTRYWVMHHKWVRDDLDWTPWTPVLYPEKVEHQCQECGKARHKGAKLWWKLEKKEGFTCHSCFFKQSDGGLPKGYEGCTNIKEIAARKEALETQPSQMLTARGLTGQSWKPPKTSSPNSRSFSTSRAFRAPLSEKTDIEDIPPQVSQSPSSVDDNAGVIEAKRQYQLARKTWKLAKDTDPQTLVKSAAHMHEARRKYNRVRYAWHSANNPTFLARRRIQNHNPGRSAQRDRYDQIPESREKAKLRLRLKRANDPDYKLSEKVYLWMLYYPMARKMLSWTPYQPILYSERVEHFCQGCRFTRVRGLRLWWKSVSSTDMYSCHTCFMKSERGGLPEAYKGCTTITEMNERFKQLEGVRPKKQQGNYDVEVGQGNTREP